MKKIVHTFSAAHTAAACSGPNNTYTNPAAMTPHKSENSGQMMPCTLPHCAE